MHSYLSYIAELGAGRLVRRESDGNRSLLRMHRATQEAMLQKLNKDVDARDIAFKNVVRVIRENFPDPSKMAKLQIAQAHVWPLITRVLPHLLTTFSAFERSWPSMKSDMFFAQLLSDIAGIDLFDRGRISETYKINKMIEKVLDSLNYHKCRLMGNALIMIGLRTDYMALSKRQEGLEIRQRCVEIRQHYFASIPPHEVTLEDMILLYNSYTDLALSQLQINDFDGARKNVEQCYARYQQWGTEGEIPYEYSKFYSLMANVLLYENESEKAVEFAKKGGELVEQATPGTQATVACKFVYANILFQHGDQHNALKILKEILKVCKRDCGNDNVHTLEVRLNVGIVSYFLKEWDYAE